MGADFLTWMWLGAGIALIVGELVLPGLVSVFGGIAALMVAGLSAIGLTESLPAQLVAWMLLSVSLVLSLRKAAQKYFKGDVLHADIDEARMHYGKTVEVLESFDDRKKGRILYQGSTWSAISTGASFTKGESARLVFQDNLTWVVESVDIDAETSASFKKLTESQAESLKVPAPEKTTHQ